MSNQNAGLVVVMALLCCGIVAAAAAAPDVKATAIKFSDGTAIEIVGIAQDTDAPTKWWAADGSDVSDPHFVRSGMLSMSPAAGTKALLVVVKPANKALGDRKVVARVEPNFDRALLKLADTPGAMLEFHVPAPADRPTFNLRLGLSQGDWKETVLWQQSGGAATTQPADAPVKFLDIGESDGQTLVRLRTITAQPKSERKVISSGGGRPGAQPRAGFGGGSGGQMRGSGRPGGGAGPSIMGDLLFAGLPADQKVNVVTRGKKLQPIGFEGSGDTTTLRFGCRLSDVDRVVAASRALEWIEVQNISAQPAAIPTAVKAVPVAALAPAASGSVKETTP